MKKEQPYPRTTLIKQRKDKQNSIQHCLPETEKSIPDFSEKISSPTDALIIPFHESDTIVNFLLGQGHQAKMVSQHLRPKDYQITFFDLVHRERIEALWLPQPAVMGVEAEITINLLGEKSKIRARFRSVSSPHDPMSGIYLLEVRSFQEFIQWYNKIISTP